MSMASRGCPYLCFISHRTLPKHGYLSTSFFLKSLDGVALRSQNLSNKIELEIQKEVV